MGEWRGRRRLGEDAFGHLDVNDGQWRSFRQHLPVLVLAAAAATSATRVAGARCGRARAARLACGVAMACVAHGAQALGVLGLCVAFHGASRLPRPAATAAVWALVVGLALAKEPAWGLRRLEGLGAALGCPALDAYGGVLPLRDAAPLLSLRLASLSVIHI